MGVCLLCTQEIGVRLSVAPLRGSEMASCKAHNLMLLVRVQPAPLIASRRQTVIMVRGAQALGTSKSPSVDIFARLLPDSVTIALDPLKV